MVEIIEFPVGEAMKEKTVTQDVKINPEFEKLIRPLDKEEFEGLEEQILAWGSARDPLVMWNGYLVDGHHRHTICTKHGLPFNTVNGKFEDEDDVLVFIINNQIKKRNLNDFEKASYIVLLKKILARKEAKKRQGKRTDNLTTSNIAQHGGRSQQKDNREGRVDHILAKEAGVSHKTIYQVSKILDHASEETKQKLKKGQLSVRKDMEDNDLKNATKKKLASG